MNNYGYRIVSLLSYEVGYKTVQLILYDIFNDCVIGIINLELSLLENSVNYNFVLQWVFFSCFLIFLHPCSLSVCLLAGCIFVPKFMFTLESEPSNVFFSFQTTTRLVISSSHLFVQSV